jgi:hypothetical protein
VGEEAEVDHDTEEDFLDLDDTALPPRQDVACRTADQPYRRGHEEAQSLKERVALAGTEQRRVGAYPSCLRMHFFLHILNGRGRKRSNGVCNVRATPYNARATHPLIPPEG